MDDSIVVDFKVAGDNLMKVGCGLGLWKGLFRGDEFWEVTSLTKLSYYVGVIGGGLDMVHFDNTFLFFEGVEHLYLWW
jgi:hypothetical protein